MGDDRFTFATINDLDRRARRAANAWSVSVSYADQLAADIRDDQKRAESLRRPSTSTNPVRCAGCGEWSLGVCRYCRR